MSTGQKVKESVRLFVLMGMGGQYSRDILRGVARYESPRRTLHVVFGDESGRDYITENGLGPIISMYSDDASQEKASKCRFPVVNVSNRAPTTILPRVVCDDVQVGRLAAEHLMSAGLRRFAVCASLATVGGQRCKAFRERVQSAGFECVHIEESKNDETGLLGTLPKPVGLFAYNDHVARKLTNLCREAGLSIPGDVAIVGVDNDELLCAVVRPYVSSVDVAADRIGYEAARLIDRILSGHPAPRQAIRVQPRGVVVRESSDFLAVDNERLARAIQVVRDRAPVGVTVSQVAREVNASRRALQRLYSDHFGGSLRDYINRLRYDNVHRLLRETDRKVQDIAESAGFRNYPHFNENFRKRFGKTPGQYRNQFRVR